MRLSSAPYSREMPPPDVPEDPCEVILCPVCKSEMQLTYDRDPIKVCVCTNCLTSLSVPADAWRLLQKRVRQRK